MRLTIRIRVLGGAAVGVVALGAMLAVAAYANHVQSKDTTELARVSGAMSAQWNADMMHDGLRADVMSALNARTEEQRAAYGVDEVTDHVSAMTTNYDSAAAAAPAGLRAEFADVRPAVLQYTKLAQSIVDTARTDHAAAATRIPEFLTLFSQLEDKLGTLDDDLSGAVEEHEQLANDAGLSGLWWILACGFAAAIAFVGFSVWTYRAIHRPMMSMLRGLKAIAGRDLTHDVEVVRDDELGEMARALNEATGSVREVLVGMGAGAEALLSAGTELDAVSERLGRAAEETLSRTGEATASAGRVTDAVERITAASGQISQSVQSVAGASSDAVSSATGAARTAEETATGVERLREASQEIGEIVRAITSIAEQTNLLALNATIEAARAGDAGKGFAVVAAEVKDLAQETAKATEDVKTKIGLIQEVTGETVGAIGGICTVIDQINDDQRRIASAVDEQSRTTEGIVVRVGEVGGTATDIKSHLDGITSSAAATADGAAATQQSAATLATTARRLDELVRAFTY
jgi:methyl-accepting chemotaxis protein